MAWGKKKVKWHNGENETASEIQDQNLILNKTLDLLMSDRV